MVLVKSSLSSLQFFFFLNLLNFSDILLWFYNLVVVMVVMITSFGFTVAQSCVVPLLLQHVAVLLQQELFLRVLSFFAFICHLRHWIEISSVSSKMIIWRKMALLCNTVLSHGIQQLLMIYLRRITRRIDCLSSFTSQKFLIRLGFLWHWCLHPLIGVIDRSQILLWLIIHVSPHLYWRLFNLWCHH